MKRSLCIILILCVLCGCAAQIHEYADSKMISEKIETVEGCFEKHAKEIRDAETSKKEAEANRSKLHPIWINMTGKKPKNPIDFATLQNQNPDIYAYIEIPKLNISYPIYQSEPGTDKNFYLHHNINREYTFSGTIYTQWDYNSKDFTDPVTLIYGHNMLDGTMFSNLQDLLDWDTFSECRHVQIFLPEKVLIYEIVSAFQFDKRHVLYTYDCTDKEQFQTYINFFTNPPTGWNQYMDDAEVTTNDTIVTLSTCLEHGASRLLVQCKLIDEIELSPYQE